MRAWSLPRDPASHRPDLPRRLEARHRLAPPPQVRNLGGPARHPAHWLVRRSRPGRHADGGRAHRGPQEPRNRPRGHPALRPTNLALQQQVEAGRPAVAFVEALTDLDGACRPLATLSIRGPTGSSLNSASGATCSTLTAARSRSRPSSTGRSSPSCGKSTEVSRGPRRGHREGHRLLREGPRRPPTGSAVAGAPAGSVTHI